MNARDAAASNLESMRQVKVKTCAEAGGPEDMVPLLVIEFEDGQVGLAALPDGRDTIVPAVQSIREERDVPIVSLTFCADALIREFDPSNEPDAPKSPHDVRVGDLTRMRESGDMRVQDVLMVTAVDVKGEMFGTMQRYGYGDNGEVQYGEATDLGDLGQIDGAVPDLLKEAIQ